MSASRDSIQGPSRRHFLRWGGAAALACAAPRLAGAADAAGSSEKAPAAPPGQGKSLKLGVASYTFRNFKLDKTLAMTKRSGVQYICLKSMHLPLNATLDEIAAVVEKIAHAGLTLYGAGVISMGKEAEIANAFEYGKAAGMKVLVSAPTAPMLPLISEKVKQYGIAVAIHNHGPGDKHFPTPQSAYEKIKDLDPRLGLCIDIGHTVRAGVNLVEQVEMCADRLLDMHFKDVTEATAKGACIQLGRGVIDFPALFRTLLKIKYGGVISYEYEAEGDDPLPGLCECVGYTKGALAALRC
ncbi:MAG: sugar phosphate isomerase/epimerase [Thermoguttaceae bacterium]|jgi:sugar phosphate isomerase/epimerase